MPGTEENVMMNVFRIVVMLFVVGIFAAHANETNLTLTLDGVTYSNVTFGTVTTSSVYIHHSSGITRLPLAKLPMELQERFGYEPTHEATAEQDAIRAKAAARAEHQAARAKAEAKAETEKVIEVKFVEVFNIKSKSDGTYSANITMKDEKTKQRVTKLVLFNEGGLGFMRKRLGRSGKVYAVEIEANVTNIYGVQTDDSALYLVGSTTYTPISEPMTYVW